MSLRPSRLIGLVPVLFLLAACASTPAPVKSPEAYFKDGETALAAKKYEDAITQLKKVRESFANPELSMKAELMIADAHYDNKEYVEASAGYEEYRKLHPRNEKASYALYRLSLANYRQIIGIDTEQTPVKNAISAMESYLTQYPAGEYGAEIKQKLADCRIKQLEYENYVGNFYLRTDKYPSAIKRLNEALVRFPGLPKLDDTLFYLGKAYLESGDKVQAKATLNRLLEKYPASPRVSEAVKLLKRT